MTIERPTGATNPRLKCVRIEVGADARSYVSGDRRVTLVPLTIKRRQNRKLLIPPPRESMPQSGGLDEPMIKMLGKAFYWQRLLDEGALRHRHRAGARPAARTRLGGRGTAADLAGARHRRGHPGRTPAPPSEPADPARAA